MSDDGSINFGAEDSVHIEVPARNNFSNFNNHKSNLLKLSRPSTIKYINVLDVNKSLGKLILHPQFQQFISIDNTSCSIAPISFLGTKRIGKSFLLDNLLELETGDVRKVMSRNGEQLVNCPNLTMATNNGGKSIFLDYNGDPNPPLFSFLYYISSVMVYNLSSYNENEQNLLFQCLVSLFNNIKSSQNVVSKPKMIVIRRDTGTKQIFDFDLVRKIQQFSLFQPQIIVLHFPYPGNQNVMARQLLDIPKKQLSPIFINEVVKLNNILKQSGIKQISNETLNCQSLGLAMQYLTKSLNNQQSISTKKIMAHIYEDLSVGYYNNYLKLYSEELQRQFVVEDPCDKYTIYKKLSTVKRRVSKKMDSFALNSNDPIFQRYKQKLQQTIKSKEALVKSVNQAKSREYHLNNLKQISEKLNHQNYEQLIDRYCKSSLDEQKTEVLLENWQKIIKNNEVQNPIIQVSKTRITEPPAELIAINKELQQIDKMIMLKSKTVPKPQNYDTVKSSIENKKTLLLSLKQEQQKLEVQTAPKFILNEQPQNQQLSQLQHEKQRLNADIEKYNKEIQKLEKLRASKMRQTTARLQQQLRMQEQNLNKMKSSNMQQIPRVSKLGVAGKDTKKTCCNIM